jgi:hypothetical protein
MINNSKGLGLSETVEVFIKNTSIQKFNFPDTVTNLDRSLIHGIAISDFSATPTNSGNICLPNAEVDKGFLNLVGESQKKIIGNIPLDIIRNNTEMKVFLIEPVKVDIRESFVLLPLLFGNALSPGGNVIVFTFFYNKI